MKSNNVKSTEKKELTMNSLKVKAIKVILDKVQASTNYAPLEAKDVDLHFIGDDTCRYVRIACIFGDNTFGPFSNRNELKQELYNELDSLGKVKSMIGNIATHIVKAKEGVICSNCGSVESVLPVEDEMGNKYPQCKICSISESSCMRKEEDMSTNITWRLDTAIYVSAPKTTKNGHRIVTLTGNNNFTSGMEDEANMSVCDVDEDIALINQINSRVWKPFNKLRNAYPEVAILQDKSLTWEARISKLEVELIDRPEILDIAVQAFIYGAKRSVSKNAAIGTSTIVCRNVQHMEKQWPKTEVLWSVKVGSKYVMIVGDKLAFDHLLSGGLIKFKTDKSISPSVETEVIAGRTNNYSYTECIERVLKKSTIQEMAEINMAAKIFYEDAMEANNFDLSELEETTACDSDMDDLLSRQDKLNHTEMVELFTESSNEKIISRNYLKKLQDPSLVHVPSYTKDNGKVVSGYFRSLKNEEKKTEWNCYPVDNKVILTFNGEIFKFTREWNKNTVGPVCEYIKRNGVTSDLIEELLDTGKISIVE